MKKTFVILGAGLLMSAAAFAAPTFSWVNGTVTSITAQQPAFTVFVVNNTLVRFCDSTTGADYPVTSDNVFYDLLKTAMETKRKVQVGVYNFGQDPQSGSVKQCINRVVLSTP
jgi:hypothetical protein